MKRPPPSRTDADDFLSVAEDDTLERELFDFLNTKYVQSQDARQRQMGLQYMGAETHDLAKEIVRWLKRRRKN